MFLQRNPIFNWHSIIFPNIFISMNLFDNIDLYKLGNSYTPALLLVDWSYTSKYDMVRRFSIYNTIYPNTIRGQNRNRIPKKN